MYTALLMDAVTDIKARLPIEDLVGQYCALQKKGRNFVALCPFHKDSHPSFLVSPDKGIAYCFACQSGGDIFSFYQKIEGVDFRQALKDLGEKTGVKIEDTPHAPALKKDEKERLRECLEVACLFFHQRLASATSILKYLSDRAVTPEQIEQFQIGFAPDSFTETYEHLLKQGFSRKEILAAGMGVQRELKEERIYDRFRNRLMFPIHDLHGAIVGFGGRTMGDDDAKYINSSDGVLYHKSSLLFGMHFAKEAIREKKTALLVEGYFDVLACHSVGAHHAVATSGTALTVDHVKILKRCTDTVCLCLDSDRAGKEAAERAFLLLSAGGLNVRSIQLPKKDASELLSEQPQLLRSLLDDGGMPYLDCVLEEMRTTDLSDSQVKRQALQRLLTLLSVLPFAVERDACLSKAAGVLSTTETALKEDLSRVSLEPRISPVAPKPEALSSAFAFSKLEIALCLFLLYPKLHSLLAELIAPVDGFALRLFTAIKELPEGSSMDILDRLTLSAEDRERTSILMLFGEEHGFTEWSDSLAIREIRRNCHRANQDALNAKMQEITTKLRIAQTANDIAGEVMLKNQFEQVRRLMKIAH